MDRFCNGLEKRCTGTYICTHAQFLVDSTICSLHNAMSDNMKSKMRIRVSFVLDLDKHCTLAHTVKIAPQS